MPHTVASLNEDSKQYERIEHSPEDLASIVLHKTDEPLIVDLRRRLGLSLLNRFHLARSKRRVAVPCQAWRSVLATHKHQLLQLGYMQLHFTVPVLH